MATGESLLDAKRLVNSRSSGEKFRRGTLASLRLFLSVVGDVEITCGRLRRLKPILELKLWRTSGFLTGDTKLVAGDLLVLLRWTNSSPGSNCIPTK